MSTHGAGTVVTGRTSMGADGSHDVKGHMILRDRFAENRTVLANERTFLAYIRTALAFVAAGLSFIKFFDTVIIIVIGWVLLPIGVYTMIIGVLSFRKVKTIIKEEEEGAGPVSSSLCSGVFCFSSRAMILR